MASAIRATRVSSMPRCHRSGAVPHLRISRLATTLHCRTQPSELLSRAARRAAYLAIHPVYHMSFAFIWYPSFPNTRCGSYAGASSHFATLEFVPELVMGVISLPLESRYDFVLVAFNVVP
eukprot:scaffold119885_cov31-Tisochrysis_lutea.AAC.1